MMEARLKERLVGAVVLVIAAVVFIPMALDGPGSGRQVSRPVPLPDNPPDERRTVRIELEGDTETAPAVEAEEPVSIDLTPQQQAEAEVVDREGSAAAAEPNTGQGVARVVEESQPKAGTGTRDGEPDAPWTVQVGSFSRPDNAEALAAKLRGMGEPAYVSRFDDGKVVHYRVRVGGFPSREAAQARADEIRQRTGEPARPTPSH